MLFNHTVYHFYCLILKVNIILPRYVIVILYINDVVFCAIQCDYRSRLNYCLDKKIFRDGLHYHSDIVTCNPLICLFDQTNYCHASQD